jgi:hypothetical protein
MIRKKPYNSHLTAVERKTLQEPVKWLLDSHCLRGDILDYGCGKCHELNNKFFKADGYDPYYRPEGIIKKQYDTIICTDVINTIPFFSERLDCFLKMRGHLKNYIDYNDSTKNHYGFLYLIIRNDRNNLKGWSVDRKTWMGYVDVLGWMLKKIGDWEIFCFYPWDGYAEGKVRD